MIREYPAALDRVIDGDTMVFLVDLGFRTFSKIKVRLLGVDTPERGKPGYQEAKDFVQAKLAVDAVVLMTYREDRQTFDRWLAAVELPDGTDLARLIIDAGLGEAK